MPALSLRARAIRWDGTSATVKMSGPAGASPAERAPSTRTPGISRSRSGPVRVTACSELDALQPYPLQVGDRGAEPRPPLRWRGAGLETPGCVPGPPDAGDDFLGGAAALGKSFQFGNRSALP